MSDPQTNGEIWIRICDLELLSATDLIILFGKDIAERIRKDLK